MRSIQNGIFMATFGLAPYFSEILVKELSEVPFYSLSFDQSYNTVDKKEQLDVLVRYYDVKRSKVVDSLTDMSVQSF